MIKLKHYRELDGVRALAALMVMLFHFFNEVTLNTNIVTTLKKVSLFGQTGVTLFFVLSGFLITRILLTTKNRTSYFKPFYLRRSLRIFPLYYLYLIITFFIFPILLKSSFVPFSYQWYYWIYLQNFASTFNWAITGPTHFWSLAVEEHFYFFWPVIVYFLSVQQIKNSIFGIIFISVLVRIILLLNGYGVFYFTFTTMDALAIGAYLAVMEVNGKLYSKSPAKLLILFVAFVVPTILLWTVTAKGLMVIQIIKFPLIAIIYFFLIWYVIIVDKRNVFKRVFSSPLLSYTGKISYGLYVYHPLCYFLFFKFVKVDNIILNLLGCLILAFAIASFSFYFFENKFLKFKDYFNYSSAVKQTAVLKNTAI